MPLLDGDEKGFPLTFGEGKGSPLIAAKDLGLSLTDAKIRESLSSGIQNVKPLSSSAEDLGIFLTQTEDLEHILPNREVIKPILPSTEDLGLYLTNTQNLGRSSPQAEDLKFPVSDVAEQGLPLLDMKDLGTLFPNISKDNVNLLKTILTGEALQVTLTPTDEDFDETLEIMYILRARRWLPNAPLPHLKIEALEESRSRIPLEVELHLQELTSRTEESVEAATGRHYLHHSSSNRSSAASNMQVDPHHLLKMLTNIFSVTRNHETAPLDKMAAMLYITKKFDSFGLMVVEHVFSAAEYIAWFDEPLEGRNIIGVLSGRLWGTPEDAPLVIGAHLDTVGGTPGLVDDGSGLAAIVEAARILSSSGCSFDNTIFFVAFDLEEIGTQGSVLFVKDYLTGTVMDKFNITKLTGAFILDCVATWDPKPHTQVFSPTWYNLVPGLEVRLSERNFSGDFTAVIYRTQLDSNLAYRFAHYYRALGQEQYKIEMMALQELGIELPSVSVLQNNFDFLRSDHFRFWYANHTMPSSNITVTTIPAILLTDTGPFRGRMQECYHGPCDGPEMVQDLADLGLLTKVTQAVVWTLAELARGRCGPRGRFTTDMIFRFLTSPDDVFYQSVHDDLTPVSSPPVSSLAVSGTQTPVSSRLVSSLAVSGTQTPVSSRLVSSLAVSGTQTPVSSPPVSRHPVFSLQTHLSSSPLSSPHAQVSNHTRSNPPVSSPEKQVSSPLVSSPVFSHQTNAFSLPAFRSRIPNPPGSNPIISGTPYLTTLEPQTQPSFSKLPLKNILSP
ncbi:uncharacterized protein [Cherax quadricarinatus]|uniref:uncharacterized protein n=1 Tax=Cherax quadricarinatus TaxID=27406 RepID=UPI00387E42F8